MRLGAKLPVAGPEAGRLEAQQVLHRHRARLDTEDATCSESLTHHREHLAFTGAVQHKGLAYRGQYVFGL